MEVSTKLFGTIDVGDDKIIEFPEGILGFPELKKFTLMYDNDKNLISVSAKSISFEGRLYYIINKIINIKDINIYSFTDNIFSIIFSNCSVSFLFSSSFSSIY